jgi:hypothetical protein
VQKRMRALQGAVEGAPGQLPYVCMADSRVAASTRVARNVVRAAALPGRSRIVHDDHGPSLLVKVRHDIPPSPISSLSLRRPFVKRSASIPVTSIDDDGDERGEPAELLSEMGGDGREVSTDDDSD